MCHTHNQCRYVQGMRIEVHITNMKTNILLCLEIPLYFFVLFLFLARATRTSHNCFLLLDDSKGHRVVCHRYTRPVGCEVVVLELSGVDGCRKQPVRLKLERAVREARYKVWRTLRYYLQYISIYRRNRSIHTPHIVHHIHSKSGGGGGVYSEFIQKIWSIRPCTSFASRPVHARCILVCAHAYNYNTNDCLRGGRIHRYKLIKLKPCLLSTHIQ